MNPPTDAHRDGAAGPPWTARLRDLADAGLARAEGATGLGALLAVALFLSLRLPLLGRSFWLDEAISARMAALEPDVLLREVTRVDTHPPLYYLALRTWGSLLPSDAGLRSLSLLANALHVVVLALIARRCWGARAAVLAALVAAGAPAFAFPAYEARNYALAGLLGATAWLCAVVALDTGRLRVWALAGLLAGLALLTFYYALLAAVALAAFVLAARPRRRDVAGLLLAAATAAAVCLPWLPNAQVQAATLRTLAAQGSAALGALEPAWLRDGWLRGHLLEASPWHRTGLAWSVLAACLWALLRSRGSPAAPRPDGDPRPWLRATWTAAGVYLLAVLGAASLGSFVLPRYATFLVGLYAVALGATLLRIPRVPRLVLLALLVGAGFGAVLRGRLPAMRAEWRATVASLRSEVDPQDVVLIARGWDRHTYDHYTQAGLPRPVGLFLPSAPREVLAAPFWTAPADTADPLGRPPRRAWLLCWQPTLTPAHQQALAAWRARLTAHGWRRARAEERDGRVTLERWDAPAR